MDKITFIDLETTGLNDEVDHILEVGVLRVDAKTLEQEACGSWPVHYHFEIPSRKQPVRMPTAFLIEDPFVLKMHTDNGLIAECDGELSLPIDQVESAVLQQFHSVENVRNNNKIIIGGFSPTFDLAFIRSCMPNLHAVMHHRSVNVSTMRDCYNAWRELSSGDMPELPKVDIPHRALGDCVRALQTLQFIREFFLSKKAP